MTAFAQGEDPLHYIHPGADEYRQRLHQIEHRRRECTAVLDLFTSSNQNGENRWHLLSKHHGHQRKDLVENPFPIVKANIIPESVAFVGHSFGAATAIYFSQVDKRIKGIAALDPWMFPFPDDLKEKVIKRPVPTLVICMDGFLWENNDRQIEDLLRKNHELSSKDLSLRLTMLHTRHMDQSDLPVIGKNFVVQYIMGVNVGRLDSAEVLEENCRLLVAYLDRLLHKKTFSQTNAEFDVIWGTSCTPKLRVDLRL